MYSAQCHQTKRRQLSQLANQVYGKTNGLEWDVFGADEIEAEEVVGE